MPSAYTKKGYNPISATNLFKGHPKHQAGDPVKKYEKIGFNPAVLSNLIPKQKGKEQKVKNGRKSHNECRDKERKAARLLRNSERNEKEESKSNANEQQTRKKREKDLRAKELLAEREKRLAVRLEAKEKVLPFRLVVAVVAVTVTVAAFANFSIIVVDRHVRS